MIVARDLVHAEWARMLKEGTPPLPDYIRDHPVYYAGGPAKTPPEGYASGGSFGPTTAARMDRMCLNCRPEVPRA